MSIRENDIWQEIAQESFDDAVSMQDWETAQMIARDVREEGFTAMADNLDKELELKHGN